MQKKITLFVPVLLLLTITLTAQFKKGERIAAATIGSIFFNSGTSEVSFPAPTQGYTSKTTSFGVSIAPSMGWFISGNTAIGVILNINPSNIKTNYESGGTTFQQDKSNSFDIGLGGFVRNYFNTSSSFMPFGQAGLNLGINSKTTSGFFYGGSGSGVYKTTYDGKSSGGFFANASLSLGMTKLLNPHTGLDFYAGYNFSYNKNTLKTTTTRDDGNNGSIDITTVGEPTTKFTNHGFVLGVGFQVFLEPKK